jgi:23S rRNA (pseudouridine1915-N3)-methyltransferase
MNIYIIAVGKIKDKMIKQKITEYEGRLGKGIKIRLEEVQDDPGSIGREGDRLLTRIPGRARVIALDEKGNQVSSRGFAELISGCMADAKDLAFIMGGPEGLDDMVKEKADEVLALSMLTFPHELARLILVEQIYRAFTIIRNEPYHKS